MHSGARLRARSERSRDLSEMRWYCGQFRHILRVRCVAALGISTREISGGGPFLGEKFTGGEIRVITLDTPQGRSTLRLAGPNDVLVSSTLRDLVIGSGLEFEDRGAHELKGVPGEWRLFAVVSP